MPEYLPDGTLIVGYDEEDGMPLVAFDPNEFRYDPKTGVYSHKDLSLKLKKALEIEEDGH